MRKFAFQKLTPTEEVELEGYEQALNYVFDQSNSDVKNVALTGGFGSGKSSVIRSYEKKHNEKHFLHVALAHFEGIANEDDDKFVVKIEEKIINQLIQQINPKNIPESNFKIKRTISKGKKVWWTISISVLVVFLVYFSAWIDVVKSDGGADIGRYDIAFKQFSLSVPILEVLIALAIPCLYTLVYSAINCFTTRKKIRNIKFLNTSLELDETIDKEKSFFDRHLDEILYLLVHSNADAIIFEDIDRFKKIDLSVLEHLRELCILASERAKCEKNLKEVKFLYLVNDNIFHNNTERTKFFDYIIPIIPVVDASNSYNKIKEYLQKSGDYKTEDDRFLRGLSLYIDDLRVCKNIINEYQIYSQKLSKTAKGVRRLLTIITYKNLLPNDFAELQHKRGYVYSIFNMKSDLIAFEKASLEKALDKNEEGLRAISNKESNEAEKLRIENKQLTHELTHLNNLHLHELINKGNETKVFEVDSLLPKIKEPVNNEPLEIKQNKKFVKFIIKNGYIDETTYSDYISFFYENGMTLNDKEFLMSINSGEGKDFDYEINNEALVVQNLTPNDFLRPESRNFELIDYIATDNNCKSYMDSFVYQLKEKEDYEFISEYFKWTEYKREFVKSLCKNWNTVIHKFVSGDNQKMKLPEIQEFIICCLAYCNSETIDIQNTDYVLSKYITNEFTKAKCKENECKSIRKNLEHLGIRFKNIDEQISNIELRGQIYQANLYQLNKDNIHSILKNEYGLDEKNIVNRELSAIYSNRKQDLYTYASNKINYVIKNVVLLNNTITEEPGVAREIIESEIVEDELKNQFINKLNYKFENLNEFSKGNWPLLIKNDAINYNSNVLMQYFDAYKLSSELIVFLNNSHNYLDFSIFDDCKKEAFWHQVYQSDSINDKKYEEIAEQVGEKIVTFNVAGLSDSKIKILLKLKLITMSNQNLVFIRQNYSSNVIEYIESNPEEYNKLITSNTVFYKEILEAIKSPVIDFETKKDYISKYPYAMSVTNMGYDDNVIEEILEKRFNSNELYDLLKDYEDYTPKAQDIIYKKTKSNLKVIKDDILLLDSKVLMKNVFMDPDIAFSDKVFFIDALIAEHRYENLPFIFEAIGVGSLVKLVNKDTSRLPSIPNGEKEKAILTILMQRGIIEAFDIDNESATIRVERKRNWWQIHKPQ